MIDSTGGETSLDFIKNKLLQLCRITMLIVTSVYLAYIEFADVFSKLVDMKTIIKSGLKEPRKPVLSVVLEN